MDKEEVVYVPNGILLSHKKEWNIAILPATWMDLEIIILSQKERRQILCYQLYMETKKKKKKELIYKIETDSQT